MKIIETLSNRIEEEIQDAKTYTKLAMETRDEYPELSRTLFTISGQEMEHMRMLHESVVGIITRMRNEGKEIPEKMMFIYDYLHKKHIDAAAEVKILQAMYK
jgi:rubrerythrin